MNKNSDDFEKKNYVYPIRVSKKNKGYSIEFIDFEECYTQANTEDEILSMAQDYLAFTIMDYESKNIPLPKPSEHLANVLYIQVWIPYYRKRFKEIYNKKTLTIPSWLNQKVLYFNQTSQPKDKINFSAVLVRELKEELGIH